MGVVTEEDFTHLVNQHHGEIYRYLVRVTGRVTDADDLSQETFLRAFRACMCGGGPNAAPSHTTGGPNAEPRAWLFAIATNLTKNHFRAKKRLRRAKDELARGAASLPDSSSDGSGRELGEAVERIVAELPLKQRIAFVQRKVHGFEYETIAENLGCSPESARANVFQATKKIRRELDGHAADRKEAP
jgi:RNA polymerase sigma-70 factor (ECF subfamily)